MSLKNTSDFFLHVILKFSIRHPCILRYTYQPTKSICSCVGESLDIFYLVVILTHDHRPSGHAPGDFFRVERFVISDAKGDALLVM